MELERRFVFRGNAAAVGGQIYRPDDLIVDTGGASSLTVVGGISRGSLGPTRFGKYGSLGAAKTQARGVFTNRDQAEALTNHQLKARDVPTKTNVEVEVTEIEVGLKQLQPVLRVKRVLAALDGVSPRGDEDPAIRTRNVDVTGVRIDDFVLDVEVDRQHFETHDTYAKLMAASDASRDAGGEERFIFRPTRPDLPPQARPQAEYPFYSSVVRRLKWRDREFPGSKIDGHSVQIPELGTIYFGEIFVSSFSRRLTMLRLDLGSPVGGFLAFAEIETNGIWYP
jgi:hypothetical protein